MLDDRLSQFQITILVHLVGPVTSWYRWNQNTISGGEIVLANKLQDCHGLIAQAR